MKSPIGRGRQRSLGSKQPTVGSSDRESLAAPLATGHMTKRRNQQDSFVRTSKPLGGDQDYRSKDLTSYRYMPNETAGGTPSMMGESRPHESSIKECSGRSRLILSMNINEDDDDYDF